MGELKICNIKIHVEVPLLLAFFSYFLVASVSTNLTIYRTCYLILGYNRSDCALLGQNDSENISNLEKLVEPVAATVSMIQNILEQSFSVILCFFIGPWSDQYGRKLVILSPLLGFSVSTCMVAIFSFFPNISPWYFIICSIPHVITGGGLALITAMLSYITDVTNETSRGIRMGTFEAVIAIGSVLGNLSSSYLFNATNYAGVFFVAAFCSFLGFIFTLIFIPESIEIRETENKFKRIFTSTNVKDMFIVSFQRRDNYNRGIILCGIIILSLYMFTIFGDGGVIFLFMREKLHWTLKKYTLFSCFSSIFWVFGTTVGIYVLNKLLKIPELLVVLTGLMCLCTSSIIQGLATQDVHVYFAVIIRGFGGVISPMIRTFITKIVPADEIGKVFSFIVGSESVIGLFSSPLYTTIYNYTINLNPGIFNFFTAAVYFVGMILNLLMICFYYLKNTNEYNLMTNEEPIN